MDEHPKEKPAAEKAKGGNDLNAMVKAMQQQLTFLERKIDTLLEQSGARPSRDRKFSRDSKPYRKNGRPDRDFKGGDKERGPPDRGFRGGSDRDRAPGAGGSSFRGGSKGHRSGGDFRGGDKAPRDREASERGVFIRKNPRGEHYGNARDKERSFRGDRD